MQLSVFRSALVIACGIAASVASWATDERESEPEYRGLGQPPVSNGDALAMADFETLNFSGAAACAPCHSAVGSTHGHRPETSDPPVTVEQWSASIMPSGSRDPFWRAKVQSEVLRAPDHRELIEGRCAVCHTPASAANATMVRDPVIRFDDGFLEPDRVSDQAAMDAIGCRQCHTVIEEEDHLADNGDWFDDRDRASHAFISANTEILGLLAVETALQGGDPAPLLAAIDAGRELLTHAGGLQLLEASLDDGILEFELQVYNFTGHKLPAAFPSRRVYLHTVIRDASDEVVFESGAMREDGRIIGVDSDEDPRTFEPHHRTITAPDQVQVYEVILGSTDDDVTYSLLSASQYLKDNRLVPAGFDPTTITDDILPVGACMTDPDFGPGRDEIAYRLDGLLEPRYQITIELRHQAIGYPDVRDLAEFSNDPVIARFLDLYDAVRPGSELIAEVAFEIGG